MNSCSHSQHLLEGGDKDENKSERLDTEGT